MAVLVFAIAIACHELAHVGATLTAGGSPQLVSSTDAQSDLTGVSRWGYLWIGAAGSLANWILAALGLWLAHARRADLAAFGWVMAAVNGLIPSVYMAASPLLGFGDWVTVIRRFDAELLLRGATLIAGVALTVAWMRVARSRLQGILAGQRGGARREAADRLTRIPWLTGGALALAAGALSPLGPAWALPIAAGSTLGTTWPLLPIGHWAAVRETHGDVSPRANLRIAGRGWLAAGAVAGLAFIWLFGPGIEL